jgi:TetR/AcrR family transcriptional repressor of nem operon
MGINKGSMYNTFGNKRELFRQVFDEFSKKSAAHIKATFGKHKNPVDAVKEIYRDVTRPADPIEHQKGCFFIKILSEMSGMDEEMAAIAREKLLEVEAIYLTYLKKAVKEGYLKGNIPPETLAKYLINMWNGISISRRIYGKKDLEKMVELNLEIFKGA